MVFLFQGMGVESTLAVYAALDDYVGKRVRRHACNLVQNFNEDVDAKVWDIVVGTLMEKGIPVDHLPQRGRIPQRPPPGPSGQRPSAGPSDHGGEGGASGHGGGKEV